MTNVGGTTERHAPFVPECGMNGRFFYADWRRAMLQVGTRQEVSPRRFTTGGQTQR